jgi:hypothetical protein
MSQLFRGRSNEKAGKLDKELAALESQVKGASPGYETQFLNRAGNLCVEADQPERALGYYGRAIDAYMESGRFSAAEVLCRKMVQIAPQAVRPRCTLAWLALGKGAAAEGTVAAIEDYVSAAEKGGQIVFAAKQLFMMAEATSDPELRQQLAAFLIQLDAPDKAERVNAMVFKARNSPQTVGPTNEGKLWAKLLRAAMMGPKELQEHTGGSDEDGEVLPSLSGDR